MRGALRGLGWLAAGLALVAGARGLAVLALDDPDNRAAASLRWLADDLEARADRMQTLFPEGRVFTLALTGIGWAQAGTADPALADEALAEGRRALALATDPVSRSTFGPAGGLPHGMFFASWTGRLRVAVARLASDSGAPVDTAALGATCRRLDAALAGDAVFPDSYPGAAWPADAVVGASALAACGDLVDPSFRDAAEDWLTRALDRAGTTGLLPHDAVVSDPRGSSTALMIPFVADIDPDVARAQYAASVEAFESRLLGVAPAVREYPRGQRGWGDVDSGPVVFGLSAPATVVGIAAARAAGDVPGAEGLAATAEWAGLPIPLRGRRRYALGALPVGDAFLAWAATVPVAAEAPATVRRPWRARWAAGAGALAALGAVAVVGLWRSRVRQGT